MLLRIVEVIAFAGFATSVAYTVVATACLRRFRRALSSQLSAHREGGTPASWEPGVVSLSVTIAKPLCGDEAGLYENLRSFCEQDYPDYQVIFGVREKTDPAAAIARKLIDELPGRDLRLVFDGGEGGTNRKVSNLAAMQPAMNHELIVVSDSDMRVRRDYLRAVAAPFADPRTGAATCLYRGIPVRPNVASTLGAMAINESFLPSVLVARTIQRLRYCFGATIAIRRSELEAIGGFRALASQLADDYKLGQLVSDRGAGVVLADYLVDNCIDESSIRQLFEHELRWARTIRSVRPASYAGSVLTMTLGWSVAFAAATRFSFAGLIAIAIAAILRVILLVSARATLGESIPVAPWLIPLRSILSGLVFVTAHFGRSVRWKSTDLTVAPGGALSMKTPES